MLKVLMITDSNGHTRGYHLVSTALRDAGMEVIMGGVQAPREIAVTAIQEDVDVVGYHIMCGDPKALGAALLDELKVQGAENVVVILGGIIKPWDVDQLKEIGVAEVFLPGATLQSISDFFSTSLSPSR